MIKAQCKNRHWAELPSQQGQIGLLFILFTSLNMKPLSFYLASSPNRLDTSYASNSSNRSDHSVNSAPSSPVASPETRISIGSRSAEHRIRNLLPRADSLETGSVSNAHRTDIDLESGNTNPNTAAISAYLHKMFEPHINDQNRDEFDELIMNRAERLAAKGETAESVASVLEKGKTMDRVAQATVGFVRSVPFGTASGLLDNVPALTSFTSAPASIGALAGAFSGAADTIGGSLLKKATSDTQWLSAKSEDLEPVMAEAQKAVEPTLTKLAKEVGIAFQAYTGRNILRTAVAPLVTRFKDTDTATKVDSWISAAGSPVAGAVAYSVLNAFNEKSHRIGPEYLLAHKDWETQFDNLKNTTWKDPLKNAAKRAIQFPKDVVTDSLSAARDFVKPSNLVKNGGPLVGGFAGVIAAKTAVGKAATKAGLSAPAVEALKQGTNTVLTAPIIAAWTTADVMTDSLVDQAMDKAKNALLNRARSQTVAPNSAASNPGTPGPHIAIDIEEGNTRA